MYLYLELWKPRQRWLDLDAEGRKAFVDGIGPAIGTLADAGVELIGFAFNDDEIDQRADYTYIAAWQMPDQDRALQLEKTVTDYGFHDYFEQINARGAITAPESVLAHMAQV